MRSTLPVLLLLLGACEAPRKGTETGNPNLVAARIAGGAWSSEPAAVSAGPGAPIAVDRAWLWVEALSFRTLKECQEDADHDESPGAAPSVLELVGGSLVLQELDTTTYCELTLDLGSPVVPPATAPPELGAATLVIQGTLNGDQPFRIATADDPSLRLEGRFAVAEGGADLALGFDLARWFEGIELDALPDEDGTLVLDDEGDSSDLETLLDNLESSAALYADLSGDGRLDPEDTAQPPLASPE